MHIIRLVRYCICYCYCCTAVFGVSFVCLLCCCFHYYLTVCVCVCSVLYCTPNVFYKFAMGDLYNTYRNIYADIVSTGKRTNDESEWGDRDEYKRKQPSDSLNTK